MLKCGDERHSNFLPIGASLVLPSLRDHSTAKSTIFRCSKSVNVDYSEQGTVVTLVHTCRAKTAMGTSMPEEIQEILTHASELAGDILLSDAESHTWRTNRHHAEVKMHLSPTSFLHSLTAL